MSYLIFDTETTGFPSSKLSPLDSNQARVCQIAMLLLDEKFEEVGFFYSLIRPRGWVIPEKVSAIHGITNSDCEKYGIPLENILSIFRQFVSASNILVAHNYKFDKQMLDIEIENDQGVNTILLPNLKSICTMQSMTDICRLPGGKFGSIYKWPKLQEAYQYLFKIPFEGAHDALADVRATGKIFKWLVDNGKVSIT